MPAVLEVRRDDPRTARVAEGEPRPLAEGEARFAVERFGLTANNVTYALLGEELRYWSFFPAGESGWGRVPAWGFARAVESRCSEVSAGARVFGYVPMGGELVLRPEAGARGLLDRSPHRAGLPSAYNLYRQAEPDPHDDATMVLTPLFVTSVVLARSLAGTPRAILAGASSKTALGTAWLLARDGSVADGITNAAAFAGSLGAYREVVGYDAVERLARGPATLVDFSGDRRVRDAVARHLGDELTAVVLVGATHVDAAAAPTKAMGPRASFFFAPDHLRGGLDREGRAAFRELVEWSAGWLVLERREGAGAVLEAWRDAVAGRLPPDVALSLALA